MLIGAGALVMPPKRNPIVALFVEDSVTLHANDLATVVTPSLTVPL
jgi:hypothetical protein